MTLNAARDLFERAYVVVVLQESRFNQCRAAQLAGVHRNKINRVVANL
jgi:DNA-binding protein Fis